MLDLLVGATEQTAWTELAPGILVRVTSSGRVEPKFTRHPTADLHDVIAEWTNRTLAEQGRHPARQSVAWAARYNLLWNTANSDTALELITHELQDAIVAIREALVDCKAATKASVDLIRAWADERRAADVSEPIAA